jgi:type II secretory pathway component PulC
MEKNIKESADEKLLKMVDGMSSQKPLQKAGIRLDPRDKIKNFLPGLLSAAKKLKINLGSLNKLLKVVSVILTLYFLYILVSGPRYASDLSFASLFNSGASGLSVQKKGEFSSLQDYLSQVNKRNVFLSYQQEAKEASVQDNAEVKGLVDELKLVGIIWSDKPEVMIESAKENRTYLLKQNETFGQHQIKVKSILRNSAVLEIPSEDGVKEYELR